MTEITLFNTGPLSFRQLPLKNFRGTRLAGSNLFRAQGNGVIMHIQEYRTPDFIITCHAYQFTEPCSFWTRFDTKMMRLETVISGELPIRFPDGRRIVLHAGQYHITDAERYFSEYAGPGACETVIIYYPIALLKAMQMETILQPCHPRPFPHAMNKILYELLQNPYAPGLYSFFYENMIRSLLLLHLSIEPPLPPDGLTEKETSAIYEADNFIASHLDMHFSIKKLARLVNLNEYALKRGFKLIFHEGPFERLMKRRMEVATLLLETTDQPIKEVAERAGYGTLAGFITGFRRRFNTTPVVWRERSRNPE
ncbi:MAG: AraC family transcriptional regulator [Bacteroidota bacterium]|nr:AraC family transcriptional regulator [Bacteroidota bacterium]